MSLLSTSMTACTLLTETRTSDGRGGETVVWADGTAFTAAVWKMSDSAAEVGEAPAVVSTYAVIASGVTLHFHDVFRRESDDKTFRVTKEGSDTAPPSTASERLQSVQSNVEAEEWVIPAGGAG